MLRIYMTAVIATAALSGGLLASEQATGKTSPAAHDQGAMAHLTEAQFVAMMTKHHQDGIAMAKEEEERGTSAAVKGLAAKIRGAQERELGEMKGHASHGTDSSSGMAGHGDHQKKMDEESQATMKRLKDASGEALDHAFVDEMAKHHQMAIDMVGRTTFKTDALRQMAQKMAADQKQEIAELKKFHGTPR